MPPSCLLFSFYLILKEKKKNLLSTFFFYPNALFTYEMSVCVVGWEYQGEKQHNSYERETQLSTQYSFQSQAIHVPVAVQASTLCLLQTHTVFIVSASEFDT